jgi:hypothetical protein
LCGGEDEVVVVQGYRATGKTTSVHQFAIRNNLELITIDMRELPRATSENLDNLVEMVTERLLWEIDYIDGVETLDDLFQKTEALILLDEVNCLESHNAFQVLAQWAREINSKIKAGTKPIWVLVDSQGWHQTQKDRGLPSCVMQPLSDYELESLLASLGQNRLPWMSSAACNAMLDLTEGNMLFVEAIMQVLWRNRRLDRTKNFFRTITSKEVRASAKTVVRLTYGDLKDSKDVAHNKQAVLRIRHTLEQCTTEQLSSLWTIAKLSGRSFQTICDANSRYWPMWSTLPLAYGLDHVLKLPVVNLEKGDDGARRVRMVPMLAKILRAMPKEVPLAHGDSPNKLAQEALEKGQAVWETSKNPTLAIEHFQKAMDLDPMATEPKHCIVRALRNIREYRMDEWGEMHAKALQKLIECMRACPRFQLVERHKRIYTHVLTW